MRFYSIHDFYRRRGGSPSIAVSPPLRRRACHPFRCAAAACLSTARKAFFMRWARPALGRAKTSHKISILTRKIYSIFLTMFLACCYNKGDRKGLFVTDGKRRTAGEQKADLPAVWVCLFLAGTDIPFFISRRPGSTNFDTRRRHRDTRQEGTPLAGRPRLIVERPHPFVGRPASPSSGGRRNGGMQAPRRAARVQRPPRDRTDKYRRINHEEDWNRNGLGQRYADSRESHGYP